MLEQDFGKICENGDIDAVNSAIMDIKSKVNGQRNYWDRGMYVASKMGHLHIINLLIKHGADNWNWGLSGACAGGRLNIAELMIGYGAEYCTGGLINACEGGYLDIVNLLIEKGRGCDWQRALESACVVGQLNVVELMISKRDYSYNGGLYNACYGKNPDIFKLMIEKGADDLRHMFNMGFKVINSDIINLIIKKGISIERYFKYPRDKKKIFRLHELGLPINKLEGMDGFNDLIKDIEERQHIVKQTLSDHLINDLTGIVIEYVIN